MVMMRLWEGLPYDLFAALAAITLVWGDRNGKAVSVGGYACSLVRVQRGHARMADSNSWVARASADIRLHRDSDAGDYPGVRVFYCWRLEGEAFGRAKGCRRLTVVKSPLHSLWGAAALSAVQ